MAGNYYPTANGGWALAVVTMSVDGSGVASPASANGGTGGTVAVSNFPATQPVSGTVAVSNLPASQAVTGTFWPATQPISGSVSVSNLPATQPVSGTFWQSTQPVSLTALPLPTGAAQDGNDATGVTVPTGAAGIRGWLSGIYSKLSGTLAATVSGSVSVSNFPATQPVSGTFWQTTQPISGSVSVSNLPASQAVTGTFWQATQPVSGTVTITPPSLTKGTQGGTGLTTQDLKDSGRNVCTLCIPTPIVTTATDTLQSLTGYKSGAAVTATTTPAVVTTGKTYRVTSLVLTYVAIATAGTAKVTLRANTGGVVAIGSPAVATWIIGAASATAGVANTLTVDVPEGLEFAAGAGIGLSVVGLGATQTAAAVGYLAAALYGYEY